MPYHPVFLILLVAAAVVVAPPGTDTIEEDGTIDEYLDPREIPAPGSRPLTPAEAAQNKPYATDAADIPPPTFDARTKWPRCLSIGKIWNQGKCGTCWAVVAASVLTDRICIANEQTINPYISANQAAACTFIPGKPNKTPKENCEIGEHGSYVYNSAADVGVWTGGRYGSNLGCVPYEVSVKWLLGKDYQKLECAASCTNSKMAMPRRREKIATFGAWIKGNAVLSDAEIPDRVTFMKKEIMKYGSIHASIITYDDFDSYTGGVYIKSDKAILMDSSKAPGSAASSASTPAAVPGHSIRIIGWTETAWIAANTWGKGWGEKGFIRIRMNHNEVSIEGTVFAPIIFNRDQPNPCPTVNFCGANAIDQAIPTDPKDNNAPFYLFQGTCVQQAAFNSKDGSFYTVGIAVPTKWVFHDAPDGSIVRYQLVEEPGDQESVWRIWLYNHLDGANGQSAGCDLAADNKFMCGGMRRPAVPEKSLAHAIYYDKKDSYHTWLYMPTQSDVMGYSSCTGTTCSGFPIQIGRTLTDAFHHVNALLQLDAKRIAVFGTNPANTAAMSRIMTYADDKKSFTLSPAPAAGTGILTCRV